MEVHGLINTKQGKKQYSGGWDEDLDTLIEPTETLYKMYELTEAKNCKNCLLCSKKIR